MAHPELIEYGDRLEIRSPMRAGTRVLLTALAFFPLLAPYELLIRTHWAHYLSPLFALSVLISAGAAALSAFLVFAAVAGLSSTMALDKRAATFSYSSHAPIVRRSKLGYSLADVRSIDVGLRDWSDGAPTYHLNVIMSDGTVFESGSSWSRDDIVSIQSGVNRFLAAR